MNIRSLLASAALLLLSACAATSSRPSEPPPKPVACDIEALAACEAAEIEAEGATLRDTEEVDSVNRHRWLRCIQRHNAALACFCTLAGEGVLEAPAGTCSRGR